MQYFLGVFLILHGLVHGLYAGQSARFFELKPGMTWPDGAWAFSKILGDAITRNLASIALLLAAISLAVSGAGILFNQPWWKPVVIGAATLSSVILILLWNGKLQNLDGQGVIGVAINLAISITVLLLRWPVV